LVYRYKPENTLKFHENQSLDGRERATSVPLLGTGFITQCLAVPRCGIQRFSTYSWSPGAAAELLGKELRLGKVFAEVRHAGDMGVNWEC